MISIKIINFMSSANCRSQLYSSKESFLPITYQFVPGNIYGLISDFGCGSWALSTCLGGRCGSVVKGSVFVNDRKMDCNELSRYSCFVGEKFFDGINSNNNVLTANECIKKALEISQLSFTVDEIKKMFGLSEERFNRDLNCVGVEINRISIAIGFALGKEIFCYPWMNTHELIGFLDINTLNILKRHNKIVLIPACRAALKTPIKKAFNYIINFHSYNKQYFHLNKDEITALKHLNM